MTKRKAKKELKRPLTKRPQQDDPGVIERRDTALRRFSEEFAHNLPTGAHLGYSAVDGDRFDGREFPIADGTYRVEGATYAFVFEGGAFIEAFIPQAPDFGGDDLITIRAPEHAETPAAPATVSPVK